LADGSLPSSALSQDRATEGRASSAASLSRLSGWALPVAFPLLFLNVDYLPKVTGAGVTFALSDLAVLAVVVAALLAAPAEAPRLKAARRLWLAAGAFLAFLAFDTLWPLTFDDEYGWRTHLVTAAKYGEYALLAPAVVLLVRDARARVRLSASVALWSALAAVVAIVQFAGLDIFGAWPPGIRQPSFVGVADLGALGAAALTVGFVALLWPGSLPRRITVATLAGGGVDLVLSGTVAAELGLLAAAAVACLLLRRRLGATWRQVGAVAAVTAACTIGVLALRSGDLTQYARYVGLAKANHSTHADVQTYAQRQLMAYIGIRVWRDHPVLGAGWQSIREEQVYSPYLDDAHRRFPDQPEQAFPSTLGERQYGIDDAYIQALAELGVVGLALLLVLLGAGLWLGVRATLRAPDEPARLAVIGLSWLVVTMGVWVGQGLVAGSGFAALSWLSLGLVAAGASARLASARE